MGRRAGGRWSGLPLGLVAVGSRFPTHCSPVPTHTPTVAPTPPNVLNLSTLFPWDTYMRIRSVLPAAVAVATTSCTLVSANPEAGRDAQGAKAMDAAITLAAVLAVARPHMNGVGADIFLIYIRRGDGARVRPERVGSVGQRVDFGRPAEPGPGGNAGNGSAQRFGARGRGRMG